MSKNKQWLNRLQLILLFVVFLAPLLGAYYVYYTRDSLDYTTVNSGELYAKPQDLANTPFVFADNTELSFADFERKWYLVVVAQNQCDQVCENNLLTIRQLKRMQGKNIERVVSLFVHDALPQAITDDLSKKYSVTSVSTKEPSALATWLQPFYIGRGESQLDSSRIYIIDPLGKLMMSYPADIEPKAFYKDLKRLLKVSQIG